VFYAFIKKQFYVIYNNLLRSEIVRMLYTKFRTHLRCFSSLFTLKSFQPEPAHDRLHAILGPVWCYKTDIGFTLNFVLIYAVLDHVLRWNLPEPKPVHDRLHAIFTP
jgi:hypothetical protein